MRLSCPHCGVDGFAEDSWVGRRVRCPRCQNIFLVERCERSVQPKPPEQPSMPRSGVDGELKAAAGQWLPESLEDGPIKPPNGLEERLEEPIPPLADGAAEGIEASFEVEAPTAAAGAASVPSKVGAPSSLSICGLVRDAWSQTRGVMGRIWLGIVAMAVLSTVVVCLLALLPNGLGLAPGSLAWDYADFATMVVTGALAALGVTGMMYMGVHHALGRPLAWTTVFAGFLVAGRVVVAAVLQVLLIMAGLVLFVFPGIYLSIGYTLTLPLIVERKMPIWEAMELSRQTIDRVWWRTLGLWLLLVVATAISAIPVGIGLIWTVPLDVLAVGLLYRQMFG